MSAAYWDAANLRMDENHFLQELMRAQGLTIGRIDSRFAAGMPSRIAETTAFDPYASAVAPAIVATFNDYARRELGVVSELKYELSARLYKDWDLATCSRIRTAARSRTRTCCPTSRTR